MYLYITIDDTLSSPFPDFTYSHALDAITVLNFYDDYT